jgi:large subunit ribosomal protein L3
MKQSQKIRLLGKKCGMIQVFDEAGHVVPCTVIQVEKNIVTQVKTKETDGYNALQLAHGEVKTKDPRTVTKRVAKPQIGHFKKAEVAPRKQMKESRLESVEGYAVGQEFGVEHFANIQFVDVSGISIGKGFAGVMKKYNFSGGPASHGASQFHRGRGSQGMRSTPGRVPKGGKNASQLGNARVTVQNLKVVKVDEGRGVILVKGAIPGATNAIVEVTEAVKKPAV